MRKYSLILCLVLLVLFSSGCIGGDQPTSEVKTTTQPPTTTSAPITVAPKTTTPAATTSSPTAITPPTTSPAPTTTEPPKAKNDIIQEFDLPKKSAHYESNTPEHEAVLAGIPINVVIDFNFDLAPPSSISIKKGETEHGIGETIIDSNKLAMRKTMDPNSPDGIYTVYYNACWPDGSCHDGKFQFAIKRAERESYTDITGQDNINIDMLDISFKPEKIRIKKGATVTWTNREDIQHFVNTDSHPAHTYFPEQNSRGLNIGDTYSVTFNVAGVYPYHCSAHASIMKGVIIVE
jgi:plastocyanin